MCIEVLVKNSYEYIKKKYLWSQIAHETLFKYLAILPYDNGRWHACHDESSSPDLSKGTEKEVKGKDGKSRMDSEDLALERLASEPSI